jgi:hypothetical protein
MLSRPMGIMVELSVIVLFSTYTLATLILGLFVLDYGMRLIRLNGTMGGFDPSVNRSLG